MKSLLRVVRSPGLVIGIWLAQLFFAWLGARFVASSVRAAMQGWIWLDDGHQLAALIELFHDHPEVPAAILTSLVFSLTLGLVAWTVLGGGIISRLAYRTRGAETLAEAGRYTGAMLGLTLWSLVMRALLLGFGFLLTLAWAPLAWAYPLWFVLGMLAFDEARARVVLEGARPWRPGTTALSLWAVLKRPLLILGVLLLVALQWAGLGVAVVGAAQAGSSALTPIMVRLVALLSLVFGLWRISAVIGPRAWDDPPPKNADGVPRPA